jgi:GTPase Era involved in 16S rRNA processing
MNYRDPFVPFGVVTNNAINYAKFFEYPNRKNNRGLTMSKLSLCDLEKEGFLDTSHLFFTTPGLHEDIHELEAQLTQRFNKAKEKIDTVLVVYGGKLFYVNADEPTRTMQKIIEEQGPGVARIQATHCMDMIADKAERESIAKEITGNEKV